MCLSSPPAKSMDDPQALLYRLPSSVVSLQKYGKNMCSQRGRAIVCNQCITIKSIVQAFAEGIKEVDDQFKEVNTQCSTQTSVTKQNRQYRSGVGPLPEKEVVKRVVPFLANRLSCSTDIEVAYPSSRQKCDICIGQSGNYHWAIEVKMLRFLGDNGKPNDNIIAHILSPLTQHNSALIDCDKLSSSSLGCKKAILIYGFEHDKWPLKPVIEAFELLANERLKKIGHRLGKRHVTCFTNLIHPIHQKGKVFGWEIQAIP